MWNKLLSPYKARADQEARIERALREHKEAYDKLRRTLEKIDEAGRSIDYSAADVFDKDA